MERMIGANRHPAGRGLRRVAALLMALLLLGAAVPAIQGVSFESRLFFRPESELVGTPATRGLAFEEVRFGPRGQLHGWFIPGRCPVTFLWLHGNGGNVSHRLELIEQLHRGLGVGIFIFDYQGYGRSGGWPSEASMYAAARTALAHLRARPDVDPQRIVYFGKSLGAAVAVQLAAQEPPHRLVVQSGFTSLPELARWYLPYLPLEGLLRIRFPSIEQIGQVRAPVLVIHGEADDVVPVEHAHLLYQAAAGPKQLLVVPGAGHEDVAALGGQTYLDTLAGFVWPAAPACGPA